MMTEAVKIPDLVNRVDIVESHGTKKRAFERWYTSQPWYVEQERLRSSQKQ